MMEANTEEMPYQTGTATVEMPNQTGAATMEMSHQMEMATEEVPYQTASGKMPNQFGAGNMSNRPAGRIPVSSNIEEMINQERAYLRQDSMSKKQNRNHAQQRSFEEEKQKFGIIFAQIAPYLVMTAAVAGMTIWMIYNS